jgi:hypothetical protein
MEMPAIRQHLVNKLIELGGISLPADAANINLAKLKSGVQEDLNRQRSTTKMFEILAYILLSLTGIFALIRLLDLASWPDMNKGALFIFLTATYSLAVFPRKAKVKKLEEQMLLLDLLENIDTNENG